MVSSINELGCTDYHNVHVRGVYFDFCPVSINCFLGRPTDKSSWKTPSINDIVLELNGGIHNSWSRKGQLSAYVLSVKYVILCKIGLANWIPSSHGSNVSLQLSQLLFQLGTGVYVDF